MKTLENILAAENGIDFRRDPKLKEKIKGIRKAFEPFGIKIAPESDLAYFETLIAYEGLKNKLALEAAFEAERNELTEIWSNLNYQEKNRLVSLKLNELKNTLRYFRNPEGKIIWIPFFDELLNALYHHEMAIFDLEQYYRLYRSFKDRRIPVSHYGRAPYKSAFIELTDLIDTPTATVFYDAGLKSVFCLNEALELRRIPLNRNLCQVHPLHKDLMMLAQASLDPQPDALAEALLTSPLISNKAKKKIRKLTGQAQKKKDNS